MGKPEIRFNGYTDDWEQRKLGDIADVTKLAGFEFTEHVVYSDEGNIIALRGLNIKNGQLILDDVKYIDGSNLSKLSRSKLFINDIMFTYVGTVGEVAIIKENDRFYLAPNVSRIRVKSDDSPKFISHYMRTDNFKNKVIFPLIATSSQPALSMENIRKFTINIPINREEQDCLANYFDSLDYLITLHQRKCDETKKLKKYMLQKMFPQNGQKVPEIRFEGFADAWEQRKFGDLGSVSMCKRIFKEQTATEGDIPFYKIGTFGGEPDAFISRALFEEYKEKYQYPEVGDMLISASGTIGRTVEYAGEDAYFQDSNIVWFKHDDRVDNSFLKCIYSSVKWSGIEGSTIKRLYNDNFLKTEFSMPNAEEQKKIGEYFRELDILITLHQRKLEELKNVKKYMLQKMFV